MAKKPTEPQNICAAKTKTRKGICQRPPMPNGRCHIHGGKSTGPKNSLAYYRKTLQLDQAADIENPMDLTGEIAMVRALLTRMQQNPMRVKCADCKTHVTAQVTCPNDETHFVEIKDNDHRATVAAAKLLSDIVKSYKEIQVGKEINIRVEVINVLVAKIIEAHEIANTIPDSTGRTRAFVGAIERLLVDPTQIAAATGGVFAAQASTD